MEVGRQILEIGKRVAVWSGGQIEAVVFTTGSPRTIWLGHKMKRGGPGAVGVADNTSCLQLGKLFLSLL